MKCTWCRELIRASQDGWIADGLLHCEDSGNGRHHPGHEPEPTEAAPSHVCGLEGYGHLDDPPCPGCEHGRKKAEREAVVGGQPCIVEGCKQSKNEHDYLHSTHEYQPETPRPEMGKESDLERTVSINEVNGTKWAHFKVADIRELLNRAAASGTESALDKLRNYVTHKSDCEKDKQIKVGSSDWRWGICTCGLEELLKSQPSSLTRPSAPLTEAWEYLKLQISSVLRGIPVRDFDEAMARMENALKPASSLTQAGPRD